MGIFKKKQPAQPEAQNFAIGMNPQESEFYEAAPEETQVPAETPVQRVASVTDKIKQAVSSAVGEPRFEQPKRPVQRPQPVQEEEGITTEMIIDAFNSVEARLNAIEARLFRRGL